MTHTGTSAPARGSLLKALVRSTLAKDLIRINLSSVHPDSGRNAVKTLMGEDPEVFFGITGSLPAVFNSMTGGLTELAVQLKDKYPPELLKSFLASLAEDLDKEALRECGSAWAGLASSLLRASPELKTLFVRTLLSEGPKIKAGSVNALSRFVNDITREDPGAFGRFFSSMFEEVDGKDLEKAAATIANALLDQKWRLASWAWRLVKGRVKKRFGI